ncbi:MAG: chorismate-binding protein [Gemmatimonadota bacterium]|nr:chorismate-binding protein [Gemmatimonadota bacterium]
MANTAARAGLAPTPAPAPALAALRAAEDAVAGRREACEFRLDLPPLDPLALWTLLPAEEAVYWKAPGPGPGPVAAAGAAWRVPFPADGGASGEGEPWRRLAGAVVRVGAAGREEDDRGVRLFGGAAFDPDAPSPDWGPFGRGDLVWPAWVLECEADRAVLRIAFGPDEDAPVRRARLAATARLVGRLCAAAGAGAGDGGPAPASALPPTPPVLPPVVARRDLDRRRWAEMVEAGRARARDGRLRKIVLARRCEIEFAAEPDPVAVLRRLAARGGGEFVFGFRRAGACFVGASPELLLERCGRRLRIEALAGTRRLAVPGGPDDGHAAALIAAAESLYGSGKDLEEHALVVRGIVDAVAPLAGDVAPPGWPAVRRIGDLAHLRAEIDVTLRPGVTTDEALAALHPTPAVGGLPRREALAAIREVEPVGRGWYAGPVGWISAAGDAEFAVAIRSALLRGRAAWLYAGAGIVAASEAEAEYAETEGKLGRLLDALAVEER